MNISTKDSNEQSVSAAFSKQAPLFDALYLTNMIVHYKRQRVREHVLRYLPENSSILELNSGTGEDAIFFASRGHCVHATDISEEMLKVLKAKLKAASVVEHVTTELVSYTALENLQHKGPYDLIFSNFAGLNCTDELTKVLQSFAPLLKPEGLVVLVILPKFCLWESLLTFKGKFKTVYRRWFSSKGRKAHVEGTFFTCWYYNPSYIIRRMRNDYHHLKTEGLCTIVPPSYIEHFAEKYPRLFYFLKRKEKKLKSKWPWRSVGDYYIISFRKRKSAHLVDFQEE
jgi:ubiquinone/menaquinone biosynthesis C-methylase UbiE